MSDLSHKQEQALEYPVRKILRKLTEREVMV